MLPCLNNWRRIAYCTARLQKICGLKKVPTCVTLIAPSTSVSAAWASSLHEPVRQEPVTLWTVKLLGFLCENVAVLVDFQQKVVYKFFVHRIFCAGIVAKCYAPPFKEARDLCMVPVCQLFWRNIQSNSLYLDGCPMLIGASHVHNIFSL